MARSTAEAGRRGDAFAHAGLGLWAGVLVAGFEWAGSAPVHETGALAVRQAVAAVAPGALAGLVSGALAGFVARGIGSAAGAALASGVAPLAALAVLWWTVPEGEPGPRALAVAGIAWALAGFGAARLGAHLGPLPGLLRGAGRIGLGVGAGLAAAAAWPTPAPSAAAKNVLLLSLDSVRADVFERYAAEHASEELRTLLAESRVFRSAYTTGSHSLPSHASMLSGLYPPQHGARVSQEIPGVGLGSPLEDEAPHVAARLGAAGYQTVAIVHNAWLGPPYGLERGFETHLNRQVPRVLGVPMPKAARDGTRIGRLLGAALGNGADGPLHPQTRLMLDWLSHRESDRPFFAFFHFIDMHVPHDPPPDVRERFVDPAWAELDGTTLAARLERGEVAPEDVPAALRHLHALSLARLWETDRAVAPLLATLRDTGLLDQTLVILTSDHGDDLFERLGTYGHIGAFEGTTRIPLAVRVPGVGPSADGSLVSLVDLAPTIYAWTGVAAPDSLPGVALGLAPPDADRAVYAEGAVPGSEARTRALITAELRFLELPGGEQQLYARGDDPQERADLAAAERPRTDAFAARLAELGSGAEADRAIPVEHLDPEVQEQLRQLGYIE